MACNKSKSAVGSFPMIDTVRVLRFVTFIELCIIVNKEVPSSLESAPDYPPAYFPWMMILELPFFTRVSTNLPMMYMYVLHSYRCLPIRWGLAMLPIKGN